MRTSSFDQPARQTTADVGYPDQFTTVIDPLEILIPRQEVLAVMLTRGEDDALEDLCLAVALCADALVAANEAG